MTAPVIETTAPVDVFQSIISDVVSEAVKTSDATETPVRDEKGRFVPKAGTDTEGTEEAIVVPPGDESTAAVDEPLEAPPVEVEEPPKLPEGMVAVPKIDRDLATSFSVKDKDGDLEIPDITITFKANGKERIEPLDRVVKMAEWGFYNHEREQQVTRAKQESDAIVQQNTQIIAYAKQLEVERDRLLSSDEAYLTARAKYEQENTPEARLTREREQVEQDRNRMVFDQAANESYRFYEQKLVPAVETIEKALPTVTSEEIGAKLLLIANRFQVHTPFGTVIPPAKHQALTDAIVNEVVPWAQHVHDSRVAEKRASTQQTDAEKLALKEAADKAKTDAQKKTTLLTRTARPAQGRAAAETPPPKKLVTVEDHEQDALAATLAAMR